jgi:hypothetical protein
MMSITWLASTDQARLLGDGPDMVAIAKAPRFGMGQNLTDRRTLLWFYVRQ